MTRKPPTNPTNGDVIIGTTTFQRMPLPCHQCSLPGTDQIMTDQLLPAAARHAPHNPPTSACDELEGRPNHQVRRLHTICLLYTSDAADDLLCVDLGGRRIIKKK